MSTPTAVPAAPAPTGLALLRMPFPDHQVSLLPKQMKKDDQEKFKCQRGTNASGDGIYCGGYHARSIHLSYVGHAALTDRLLDCDPGWTWEPLSNDENGLPRLQNELLWIKLTVCGVTRLGVGDAAAKGSAKTAGDLMKERIGDALRNAALRFGAALEFWHKGVLHLDEEGDVRDDPERVTGTPPPPPPAVDFYPADKFAKNLPTWTKTVREKGGKPDDIIARIESGRFPLTGDQKKTILSLAVTEAA